MNCEEARERMLDHWTGALEPEARAEFEAHRRSCAACGAEMEALDRVWLTLGELPAGAPSPAARVRFHDVLEAYRAGLDQGGGRAKPRAAWFFDWFRSSRLVYAAAAVALVAGGAAVGRWSVHDEHQDAKLAQLSGELSSMRQLVTLSLLQQQSASDRLRGVNWSSGLEHVEGEVLSALLRTLTDDPNVNVRLAAVDALQRYSSDPQVRLGVRQALAKQNSPLIQIALVDWMTGARDTQAAPVLESFARHPDLNPAVKQRIERALARLQ